MHFIDWHIFSPKCRQLCVEIVTHIYGPGLSDPDDTVVTNREPKILRWTRDKNLKIGGKRYSLGLNRRRTTRRQTVIKGEKVTPLHMDEKERNGEGRAVNIMKTTDIYCGRPTAGYQVVRVGLDVTFTPDLNKVHRLIDEYYNGRRDGSHGEEDD